MLEGRGFLFHSLILFRSWIFLTVRRVQWFMKFCKRKITVLSISDFLIPMANLLEKILFVYFQSDSIQTAYEGKPHMTKSILRYRGNETTKLFCSASNSEGSNSSSIPFIVTGKPSQGKNISNRTSWIFLAIGLGEPGCFSPLDGNEFPSLKNLGFTNCKVNNAFIFSAQPTSTERDCASKKGRFGNNFLKLNFCEKKRYEAF